MEEEQLHPPEYFVKKHPQDPNVYLVFKIQEFWVAYNAKTQTYALLEDLDKDIKSVCWFVRLYILLKTRCL